MYHSSCFGTVTIVGNVKAISYYVNITRLWVQKAHKSSTMTSVVAFFSLNAYMYNLKLR